VVQNSSVPIIKLGGILQHSIFVLEKYIQKRKKGGRKALS
jgi:hypothetical protein